MATTVASRENTAIRRRLRSATAVRSLSRAFSATLAAIAPLRAVS
jgi:hypothetical protein